MSTATFDTLRAARDLAEAGFERKQAEAIAQAINQRGEAYATKADIADLRADMAQLEKRLTLAMIRVAAVAVSFAVALNAAIRIIA